MPQLEFETREPSTITDSEGMQAIQLLTKRLRIDDEHFSTIVCSVLLAYIDRRHGLPDWWVWTRFAATFGRTDKGDYLKGSSPWDDTWLASDTLTELLVALRALHAYERSSWWQRFRARRIQRKVYRKILRIGARLNDCQDRWWDRHDFAKYQKQARS